MASIPIIQTTLSTQTSTESDESDFVEVITSADLTSGKTYYVICSASTQGTSTSLIFSWRLYDETNSEVLSNSTTIRESNQSLGQPYYYVGEFTAGSGGGGLQFQQKGYAAGSPEGFKSARTNFLSMIIFDIDDMDESDWFYENLVDQDINNTVLQDRVTHTETGVVADDVWLVFGWMSTLVNDEDDPSTQIVLNCADAETEPSQPSILFEGEDLDEELQWMMCRSYSGLAGSVTWKMQSRDDDTPSTGYSYHKESTLFALKMNAFLDSYQQFTTTATTAGKSNSTLPSADDWITLETHEFTSATSAPVIVVGCSIFDCGGATRKSGQRITEEGTVVPSGTVLESYWYNNTNDFSDELPNTYISAYTPVAKIADTINYDVITSTLSAATPHWQYNTLAIFSTTLESSVSDPLVFDAVATQAYTSGDVAAEANP